MTHSRLIPVIETARLIQCRLQDVLLTFVTHRITNAVATDPSSAARRRVHYLDQVLSMVQPHTEAISQGRGRPAHRVRRVGP